MSRRGRGTPLPRQRLPFATRGTRPPRCARGSPRELARAHGGRRTEVLRAAVSTEPEPIDPTSAVRLRRTGTPTRALDPPPRGDASPVRVRATRPCLRRAVPYVPGVISARVRSHACLAPSPRPISRSSLSRSSPAGESGRSHPRPRPSLGDDGAWRRRTATRHGARPRSEGASAIPAEPSPPSRDADTPCRLSKARPAGISLPSRRCVERRRAFART